VGRRRQLGKTVNPETLVEARRYVEEILKTWGDTPLNELDPEKVINHLFEIDRSGSWKNRYLSVLKEIYSEAPRHGYKAPCPPSRLLRGYRKRPIPLPEKNWIYYSALKIFRIISISFFSF